MNECSKFLLVANPIEIIIHIRLQAIFHSNDKYLESYLSAYGCVKSTAQPFVLHDGRMFILRPQYPSGSLLK